MCPVTGVDNDSSPQRPSRHRQIAALLLSTAAGGMFFNLLSADIGYWGVAVVTVAGLLVAYLGWVRTLPRSAPLVKFTLLGVMIGSYLVLALSFLLMGESGEEHPAATWSLLVTALMLLGSVSAVNQIYGFFVGALFLAMGVLFTISDMMLFGFSGRGVPPIVLGALVVGTSIVFRRPNSVQRALSRLAFLTRGSD
jgi:hypothetical protein